MAVNEKGAPGGGAGRPGMDRGLLRIGALLLFCVILTSVLRTAVSFDALAPAVATVLFGLAALVAAIGLLMRRSALRADITRCAGLLTFIGVGVSVAIEPDQLVGLLTWPDRTD